MNAKKVNRIFLATIILQVAVINIIYLVAPPIMANLVANNLVCELIIVLPVLAAAFLCRENLPEFLGFHKIKPGTIFMCLLFAILSTPLFTLFNLITQFWVDSQVLNIAETFQIADMPFGMMYLSIGIIAPIAEEIACRGAYYRSYKRSGSILKAGIMSAIIFALIHMNINQAAYAFVIGILAVLLVEATGSLWSSILLHGFINGSQVILLRLSMMAAGGEAIEQASAVTGETLLFMVSVYLILAAAMTPLAWASLVWMEEHEGRKGILSGIWKDRKQKKDKMLTVPFVLALILCIAIFTGVFAQLAQFLMSFGK